MLEITMGEKVQVFNKRNESGENTIKNLMLNILKTLTSLI